VPEESTILVGRFDDLLWVRITGRGSFANSPALKSLVVESATSGLSRFVVDLAECPVMDSTFMGTLTSAAIRLRECQPPGSLQVVNANERNLGLLESLGLDQVFDVDRSGNAYPELRPRVAGALLELVGGTRLSQQDHAAHVLEAHEVLSNTNPANRERFRDVVSYLRSETADGSTQS